MHQLERALPGKGRRGSGVEFPFPRFAFVTFSC
jgi:hypothetical protein